MDSGLRQVGHPGMTTYSNPTEAKIPRPSLALKNYLTIIRINTTQFIGSILLTWPSDSSGVSKP
jgi:hypothetical protein